MAERYHTASSKPTVPGRGYDPDVAKLIADALGVKLEIVQVDPPSRVPVLVTGKVDLVISVLGITPERLKQISFTRPYSSLDVVLVAAKGTKLASYDDLKNIRTAVVRSASHAQLVEKIAPAGSSILSFDDDFAQVQAVANAQADALASSPDVVEKLLKARPDFDPEIKLTLHRQFNAIGVKRGSSDLLRYVNSVLAYYTLSQPVIPDLQKKYFGKPFENLPQF
ncbi:transporter substrate-binding domain-containing protein (plasmid) [Rhizobium sp. RCAM05350]|uniref:transporter substrate-binding domain-containing protein n=1 Tax=Rhizobium sp. RCAM05350 TaxID=2895568 RepID=UPI0020769592|nr:transporter substrate-binding domain-containing protein [Rhizobium sp. RCAM05350]URK89401.1 transporter substrate-binding domain-containing protein [Rhizobium sp. RCAM05350]